MTTISSVTVEIAAPARFVWDILVDYAHYPQWNPYTLAVATDLELDSPIDLTLPNPDGSPGTFVSREYVRVVDPPRHLRYDTGGTFPGLLGTRDQWLEPLDAHRCAYRTTETFSGPNTAWVTDTNGGWVKNGFDAVAHALKARAERLWRADNP